MPIGRATKACSELFLDTIKEAQLKMTTLRNKRKPTVLETSRGEVAERTSDME